MKNRTTVLLLLTGILAGSFLLRTCDSSTGGQDELEQELRFFNIFRQANYPDAVHQASGIYFQENLAGTGAAPGDTSWLFINHVAYTIPEKKVFETYLENVALDRRVHDTSALYGPYKVQNNRVNEGFVEGMKLMREGGKATFMFTSELGYGAKNSRVGDYASLLYEVELLEVIDDIIAYESDKIRSYIDTIAEVQGVFDTIHNVFMYYVIDESTDGPQAGIDSTIQVAYKGYLPDGRVFDESREGVYYTFKIGDEEASSSPIAGWHMGLANFREGEKGRLIIPHQLAYGENGRFTPKNNVSIPPYENLVFDVEVISVEAELGVKPK